MALAQQALAMDKLIQDLIVGLRALLRRPVFTVVAAMTLALGVGANTAIFSVVNAVVLRPLPFAEPDRLMYVGSDRNGRFSSLSPPEYVGLREQTRSFGQFGTWVGTSLNLVGGGDPERISGARVTANLLPLLGVEPLLGRNFTDEEDREGSDTVVLLSHRFWERRHGADREVVGQRLRLNDRDHEIVGVLPPDFSFPNPEADLFVPMAITQIEMENPGAHYLIAIGRLTKGVSVERANAELGTLGERITSSFGEGHRRSRHGATLVSMLERMIEDYRAGLLLLLGSVGFVLLIACSNVANLMLVRAAERERELAVRSALGAGRGRLIRQLLTESLVLAFLGGAGGFLLGLWSIDLILGLSPADIPRIETTSVDLRVFGFVAGVSFVTALIFGLVPAIRASKTNLRDALTEASRGSGSGFGTDRSKGFLVVAEVALALVLLIGSGLLMRSFWLVTQIDPGFKSQNVLTVRMLLPEARYSEAEQMTEFAKQLVPLVNGLTGVRSAGLISPLPMTDSAWRISIEIQDRVPESADERLGANWHTISAGYFKTMGIPLIRGRDLTETDGRTGEDENGDGGRSVMLVSESFARRYWPNEEPLGKWVRVGYDDILCEVVGVVGDVRNGGLADEAGEEMYTPFPATPWQRFDLAIRTSGDPMSVAGAVREAVWRVDPDQPVYDVNTMPELVAASVAPQRFMMVLMGIFAGVALLLAAVGIYGVISYSVVQRRREIGIRVALGAGSAEVLKLVMAQGARLIAAGVFVGLVLSYVLMRFLTSQLYGITATDPLTYLGVASVLVLVALLAILTPARRAARVDPMVALRYE